MKNLEGEEHRTARFVSAICCVFPNGDVLRARGTCEGRIATYMKGENGFGYDAMFIADGEDRTMAEMTHEEKNEISHRGRALREFARVLAPEGSLYTVVPGARHLFGLKEVLYDTPYLNDEKLPQTTELELVGTQRVSANITLQTQADIEAVFQMTPYYYRTRPADKERLVNLDTLQTDIDFIIAEYRHS